MDLPGVLATAGRVPACLPGALALQCLAELALHLVLGTVTLRSNVSHAGLPPGQRYIQPGTCDTGKPPARAAWLAWRHSRCERGQLGLEELAGVEAQASEAGADEVIFSHAFADTAGITALGDALGLGGQ
jgi:hypothetical protein